MGQPNAPPEHLYKSPAETLEGHHQSLKQFIDQWCAQQHQILQAVCPGDQERMFTFSRHAEHTRDTPAVSPQNRTLASVEIDKSESIGFVGQRKKSHVFDGAGDPFEPAVSSNIMENPKSKTKDCIGQNTGSDSFHSVLGLHEAEQARDCIGGSLEGAVKADSFRSMRSLFVAESPPQPPLSWLANKLYASKSTTQKNAAVRRNCRWQFSQMVSSHWFESVCGAAILGNAVVIAYEADCAAQSIGNSAEHWPAMKWLEVAFTSFYTVELILRWIAHGCALLEKEERLWSIFDALLVLSGIYHQAVSFTNQSSNSNPVFLRILRIVKMLKVLRMVRVMRMFKELRLIVASIEGSMRSMLWAVVLIVIITFIVGMIFLQAGTGYLQDHLGTLSEEQIVAIESNWGTLRTAMLTLYMASTGGDSWRGMANSLIPVGHPYYILFLVYISFFLLVVMNTLTSLFLEATIQNAEKDKNTMIRETLKKKKEYMQMASELFQTLDEDGSGEISEEEFEMHAKNPELVALASSLDIDVTDIAQFYDTLSCQGKFKVDSETFIVGCMALKGTARSLDLQSLIAMHKRAEHTLGDIAGECHNILQRIKALTPWKLSL